MNSYFKAIVQDLLNQLPPGRWRAYFVLLALPVAILLTVKFPAIFGIAIICFVTFEFIKSLINRIATLYPTVAKRQLRKIWRVVVTTRQFYKVSPEAELFHALTILVLVVSVIYLLIAKNTQGYENFNWIVLFLLCTAAVFDTSARIAWLMKKAWAKTIGKAVMASLTAALYYLALALAKQTARELTGADPESFSEFVGFMTSVYTPILLGLAVVLIGLVIVSCELISIILIVSIITVPLSLLMERALGKERVTKIFDRIRAGKKQSEAPEWIRWRNIIYVMRPLAIIMALYVIIASASSFIAYSSNRIEIVEKRLLVMMQYQPNKECKNLDKNVLIAKLKQNGIVSIVQNADSSAIGFTKQNCQY